VVLEHVTRTAPDQAPDWAAPSSGGGCYRVVITGEPQLTCELSHHGEHGDHNDSGMIMTAQRLVNAIPAVVGAPAGLVTALDLPLVTGRGLVTTSKRKVELP
jgi:4-hydroxy-tetrahydrodipicolinate reductase